ncbi:NAD-dependent epimerase/dehydratase family protein [Tundrisphaera lichenicola]|uniref:NAD-dependent epimerase/dehydratase family protein n=1 Tax=Tundrisphaera lichenicola TaxID=2029860 RepID=UPI003EB6CBCE
MPKASQNSTHLVTGATGLLGSHIAERLCAKGLRVRALVRPGADVRFLKALGVELAEGDLADEDSCVRAVQGIQSVYHSAAKVGDWGNWADFQSSCLDGTRNLARAACRVGVERFLHISSTSAYGHPVEGGPPIEETSPLGQRLWPVWDYYTRSKVESEQLLWKMLEELGLRLTVIRPSWLYGERDRTTLRRLVGRLRAGKVPLIGRGDNPLSAIYAGNVADAAILASNDPSSVGEAYNITHQGQITQKEFLNLFIEAIGAPPLKRRISYDLTFQAAFLVEALARARRRATPPLITRYATWLMGRRISYSTAKAESRLGWKPEVGNRDSIERSVRWFLEEERRTDGAVASRPLQPIHSNNPGSPSGH